MVHNEVRIYPWCPVDDFIRSPIHELVKIKMEPMYQLNSHADITHLLQPSIHWIYYFKVFGIQGCVNPSSPYFVLSVIVLDQKLVLGESSVKFSSLDGKGLVFVLQVHSFFHRHFLKGFPVEIPNYGNLFYFFEIFNQWLTRVLWNARSTYG